MALIDPVPVTKTLLGTLTEDRVFTCERGHVGLTTDDGTGEDYYKLGSGERLVLTSGLTVSYVRMDTRPAILHHMPV